MPISVCIQWSTYIYSTILNWGIIESEKNWINKNLNIKCQKELYKQGKGHLYDLCAGYIMQAVSRWWKHGSTVTTPTTKSTTKSTKNARKPFATLTNTAAYKQVSHPSTKYSICTTKYRYTYIEYHSVCLLFPIGTPTPLFRKRVCPPRNLRRMGHTRLRVRWWGRGPNSDDWRKSLQLCLYSVICTYPYNRSEVHS
jgi:hypothetical protein